MRIGISGVAGFIGFHTATALLRAGHGVYGFDNLNDYYSTRLKLARLGRLRPFHEFEYSQLDLRDIEGLQRWLGGHGPFDVFINLAAQAGVRNSILNPREYLSSNVGGFLNLLELLKDSPKTKILYASSSSVYGNSPVVPFREEDSTHKPISVYAASKTANELLANVYSSLYCLHLVGLRFFTVYGSWGRPDMAYFKFAEQMREGRPISIYNGGRLSRDFTHVEDVARAIKLLCESTDLSNDRHLILNVGRGEPVSLMDFVNTLERKLGYRAHKTFSGMQPGDVERTFADTSRLEALTGYKPQISFETGIEEFACWYKEWVSNRLEN